MMNSKLNIVFAGTPDFAEVILAALLKSQHHVMAVYTQPDRSAGRGQKLQMSPVKRLAAHYDIPVHQPLSLQEGDVQQQVADYNPDIMIVVAYGLILPKAVLSTPKLGCLNVHASLLPRWRGAAPIQHAILAGDKQTGVGLVQMEESLDSGPVFAEATCEIRADDTSQTLHDRLAILGAQLLIENISKIASGNIFAHPQDSSASTYATKIKKSDAAIQWQLPAVNLERQIRAFCPWPISFSELDGQTIRIWQAKVVDIGNVTQPPGTIVQINKNGIDVATGSACLRVSRLQLPNKKPLPVSDILNAYADLFAPGKRFSYNIGESI